jgi:signal transduction histidine kinase
MLKRTVRVVSYLIFSLLVGVVVTVLIDKIYDDTIEQSLRTTVKNKINNAVTSFKESVRRHTSAEEKNYVRKFAATVMSDEVEVYEKGSRGPLTGSDANGRYFLFTLKGPDYAFDFYLKKDFLESELSNLDTPDYIAGFVATVIVFVFIFLYAENKKRMLSMKQQYEEKHAALSNALQRHEALALLGRMSATLAHELKTPVATMSNLVQTFPKRRADEQFVKRFLALMGEELTRTQQLIDNLLAYGKDIEIRNNEWIPVEPFLKGTASAGISVEIQRHFQVNGDRFYLDLLFKNLMRNSHEAGADKVFIHVNFPSQDTAAYAEIICEDNGGGFSQTADLEKLMDPFATSRSRGAGLGLYLANKIAMAHGGSLSLSRMEKGARVTVTLPQHRIRS